MNRLRGLLLCVAILPLASARAAAATDDPPPPPEARRPLERLIERLTTLLPRDVEEKLHLTEAQKKDVAKLQKQLDEKNLKIVMQLVGEINNVQEALDKAKTDNDLDGLKSVGLALIAQATDISRLRKDLETKLRAILDEDQRKIYDEQTKERERPRLRRRLLGR